MRFRIQEIILYFGLKKSEFARKINVSSPFVSEMCSGAKMPSDRTIADICRVFGVNETWLRTGQGEMLRQISEEEEIRQVFDAIAVSDDKLIKSIIRAYWRLNDNEKAAIQKMLDNLLEENTVHSAVEPEQPRSQTVEEVEAEYIKTMSALAHEKERTASNTTAVSTAAKIS